MYIYIYTIHKNGKNNLYSPEHAGPKARPYPKALLPWLLLKECDHAQEVARPFCTELLCWELKFALTTTAIVLVGSDYNTLYRNDRQPTQKMALVVEGMAFDGYRTTSCSEVI